MTNKSIPGAVQQAVDTPGDIPIPLQLQLLSRSYCHLCHEMEVAVAPLAAAFGVQIRVVDVDADPACEARWGELVPVLLDGSGERSLCHYFFDEAAVRAYLESLPRAWPGSDV